MKKNTSEPSKAVIYLRVSTGEQAESGLGLEAQESKCREYAERNGLDVAAVFTDAAVSGAAPWEECPGLLDALNTIDADTVLLVAKRDRLGRDTFRLAMIQAETQKRHARIVSAAGEGTATDEPADVLMRHIIDAFGEYERLIIAARTRAALAAKRNRKERLGTTPLGYITLSDGELVPEPEEQATVKRARELRSEGCSLRSIAATLTDEGRKTKRGGTWQANTVAKVLATRYVEALA